MRTLIFQTLEFTVLIPGMLLAYLPVRSSLKQTPKKLAVWMLPLLIICSCFCGFACYRFHLSTRSVLLPLLFVLLVLYHSTLLISLWKSVSIYLAVCAVFSCFNSLSRAVSAMLNFGSERLAFSGFSTFGILYNLFCILFVLLIWYPASHSVKEIVEDENLAQTWYVFWILPVLVIGLNLALIPKYNTILHTQRFLRGYIVIVYALLLILALFYSMFLMMANILNKNKKLQQENLFLSVQQERYENLRSAIEEARQARHDIRHHFLHARVDLPKELSVDEMDLCLILSNLLENALEASRKTTAAQQQISLEIYQHSASILLIRVENNFDGTIKEKNHLFHSTKRKGLGIGTQSVRRMAEKNDGSCNFTYEDGVFTAKVMLRADL